MNMISIIIPVYNVEKYLEKCIESCLIQSYTNIEIIAVNDGSTDSSGKILDFFSAKDSRIRVIHKHNEGVAKSRIVGLGEAKGSYIYFLDSDDTLPIDSLKLLYENIKLHNSDIAIGSYCECYPNGKTILYNNSYNGCIDITEYLELLLLDKIPNGVCFRLYRRELVNNPKYTTYKLGEDTTLLIQLMANAQKVSFIDANVYNYLQRENSAVHVKKPSYILDMYYYREWVVNYIKNEYPVKFNYVLLDLYILRGYIRCIFWGGDKKFSKKKYDEMKEIYKRMKCHIPLWERVVFVTIPIKPLNKITINLLHLIRNFKLKVYSAYN